MKPWLAIEKKSFFEQVQAQNLPHAMIISGVKGSGKKELARWLSNILLCQKVISNDLEYSNKQDSFPCGQCKSCNLHQKQTHPDLIDLELTSASIGIDQIRKVSRFFEKTAQLAVNQVVIIEDAEAMTESAANALLKTLEEPTNNSFIILLANDEQRLLPTIISRCRHIQLKPLVGDELVNLIGSSHSDPFVNLSHLSELTDENINQQYLQLTKHFLYFLINNRQRMELLALILSSTDSYKWLERIVVNLVRRQHQWLKEIGVDDFSNEQLITFINENKDKLWKVYLLLIKNNKQRITLTQVNKEYAVEKLLVDMMIIMLETEE
jgi:DNA polymerase-3 subunit delta'